MMSFPVDQLHLPRVASKIILTRFCVEWSIVPTKAPASIFLYWQCHSTSILGVVGPHLAQIHQNIYLFFYFSLLPVRQSTRGCFAGWEPLRIYIMLSNGAIAKLSLVPSKDVLVLLQHSPDLLLSFIIQFSVYPNSLANFFPPIVHLQKAGSCQFLSGFAINVTILHLDSLQQYWNRRIVGRYGLLQQQWDS